MMTTKLPTYDKYKPSGVEWLGEIPEHWEVVRLKYLFTILKRIAGKLGFDVLSITQTGIKVKDTESGEGQLSMDYSKYQLVDEGNFAMNHMDLLTGYVDVSKYDGVISPDYRVFDLIDPNSDKKYMLLLLQLGYKSRIFYAHGQGVSMLGRWRFPSENFNNFLFPVPPKEEQTAIAQFLDRKTALIDQAIDIKQKQIELLKERRQILIHQAVTRGLNPEVKMKDSGVEWIGEVPEHWEVKRLKNSTRIFRGKFTHRPRNDERLYDGNYPFFQTGDVAKAGKYLFEYKQTLNDFGLRVSTLFPKGTIVITIAANIGDISILDIDACFPDSIVGFEPMDFIKRDFLYNSLLVMKEQFMSSTIKNTQMNLNVDRIGTNSIAIPPLKEQTQIIQYIEISIAKIATAISLKEQEIEKLKEYKATLINSAVTGKIKVGSHAQ